MRAALLGAGLVSALLASSPSHAGADDPKPAAPDAGARRPLRKHAEPAVPAANATLHVTPAALGTSWTYEVTNADSTPLRLVADGRLLTLDVTPDADEDDHARRRVTIHCSLPAEVRPTTDAERVHVLAPGDTYVEEFDPRLYCFDAREAAALAPGSRVVAHLGWPGGAGASHGPPFVADETFAGATRTGVKELVAAPVVTPDVLPEDDADDGPARIVVTTPERIDAERGQDLEIEVSVENTTSRPIRMMLRPETLAFEVASPKGVHACGWSRRPGSPIAEVFRLIPPHMKASSSVLLATVCPEHTFAQAGLYTVSARVDTRHASGRSIGIESFDGVVAASSPTLVRVRLPRAARP